MQTHIEPADQYHFYLSLYTAAYSNTVIVYIQNAKMTSSRIP